MDIRSRLGAALALLALPFLLGGDRPHTELKSSLPAKDTVLAESPDAITLTYTTDVQLALSTVAVRPVGDEAAPVPAGELGHPADDLRDVLALPLVEPLGRGDYTVAWTTAGPDGHRLSGDFGFRIDPASSSPADTLREGARADADSGGRGAQAGFTRTRTLSRFLLYAGIVAVLGGLVFRMLVLRACARAGESAAAGAPSRRGWRHCAESRWISVPASFFPCSGRAAAARPRCCGSSAGWPRPPPAPCASATEVRTRHSATS